VERGAVAPFPRDGDRLIFRYTTNVMNLLSSVVFPEPRKPVRMVTYGKTDSAKNTTSQERQIHRPGLGPDWPLEAYSRPSSNAHWKKNMQGAHIARVSPARVDRRHRRQHRALLCPQQARLQTHTPAAHGCQLLSYVFRRRLLSACFKKEENLDLYKRKKLETALLSVLESGALFDRIPRLHSC